MMSNNSKKKDDDNNSPTTLDNDEEEEEEDQLTDLNDDPSLLVTPPLINIYDSLLPLQHHFQKLKQQQQQKQQKFVAQNSNNNNSPSHLTLEDSISPPILSTNNTTNTSSSSSHRKRPQISLSISSSIFDSSSPILPPQLSLSPSSSSSSSSSNRGISPPSSSLTSSLVNKNDDDNDDNDDETTLYKDNNDNERGEDEKLDESIMMMLLYHHSNTASPPPLFSSSFSSSFSMYEALEQVLDVFEAGMVSRAHDSLVTVASELDFSMDFLVNSDFRDGNRVKMWSELIEVILDRLDQSNSCQLRYLYALLSISLGASGANSVSSASSDGINGGNEKKNDVRQQQEKMVEMNRMLIECHAFPQLIQLLRFHVNKFVKGMKSGENEQEMDGDEESMLVLCNLLYIMMTVMIQMRKVHRSSSSLSLSKNAKKSKNDNGDLMKKAENERMVAMKRDEKLIHEMQCDLLNRYDYDDEKKEKKEKEEEEGQVPVQRGDEVMEERQQNHFIHFCFEVLRDTVLSNIPSHERFPFKKLILLMQQSLILVLDEPHSPYERYNVAQTETKIKEKDINYFKYRHFSSEESLFGQSTPVKESVAVMNSQEPKLLQTGMKPIVNISEREISRILLPNPTNAELLYRNMHSDLPPLVLLLGRLLVASSSPDYKGFINFASVRLKVRNWIENDRKNSNSNSNSQKDETREMERHKQIVLKSVLTIILCLIKQWRKDGHALQSLNLCQLLLDANALPSFVNIIMDRDVPKLLGQVDYHLNIINPRCKPPTFSGINWDHMYISITCLRVIQKMTKSVFYGIMYLINNDFHNKLYQILTNIDRAVCPLLVTYASKVLKNLIPFTSNEWRTRHNETLGWVYMHVNLTMCDTWLLSSKRGVNSMAGEAKKQIAERRAKVQSFNLTHYDQWWNNMNEYWKQQQPTMTVVYDSEGNLLEDNLAQIYKTIDVGVEDCVLAGLL